LHLLCCSLKEPFSKPAKRQIHHQVQRFGGKQKSSRFVAPEHWIPSSACLSRSTNTYGLEQSVGRAPFNRQDGLCTLCTICYFAAARSAAHLTPTAFVTGSLPQLPGVYARVGWGEEPGQPSNPIAPSLPLSCEC